MSPNRRFVLAIFLALQGCGAMEIVRSDGRVERHYFGYVKVIAPDSLSSTTRVSALDATAIGIRIENGLAFGYFHDREIVAPLDCRLVFLVRDESQLARTTQFIQKTMKGNDLCAAIY